MTSPILHSAAWKNCTPCMILPSMEKRHYLKEWRKHVGKTQDEVVASLEALNDNQLPTTAASLSRVENRKQPYNERLLHALAEIYGVEPWELIGRDPTKAGELIDFWAHKLDDQQKRQALAMIQAMAQVVND